MDEILKRDQNFVTVLGGITDDSDQDIRMLRVDPITKRLLVRATGISAGVTSLNGLTGAVILAAGANITLTPLGNTITIASSGGITTLAPIGASPNANGATISGTTLNLEPASFLFGGVVTTGAQTFAGVKTFAGQSTFQAAPTNTRLFITGADATTPRLVLDTYNNAGAGGGAFINRRSRGTAASPSAVQSGDTIGTFNGQGYGSTGYAAASTGLVSIKALENFTDTAMGTSVNFFATPTGSVTAAQYGVLSSTGLTLGVAGTANTPTIPTTGAVIVYSIAQTAHGFVAGDIIKSSGTANQYAKAQANSAANAEVVGIVTSVLDANNFSYATQGIITTGVPVATAGTVYFLSPSSAGAVTSTEPTTVGQVSKPVLIVTESGSKAVFSCAYRGEVIGTASGLAGSISFNVSGGGGVITTGQNSSPVQSIPYSGTITGWVINSTNGTTGAALAGSIVIDTWKDTYTNFPPTVADSIWGGSKPTLSSASKNTATGLSIPVSAGDMFTFNVDSATTCTTVGLTIFITKTS